MAAHNFLALDLGAESGRAILGRLADGQLQLRPIHRFANNPVRLPGGLHWDVLHLWQESKRGLAMAAKEAGQLSSLGLDAWGVDFALLDRNGVLLGNPYHYRDSRTEGMIEQACRRLSRKEIFTQTGIQFMPINSLYQLLSLVLNNAPILDAAETFLTIPDLFNYWLTGRRVCEFSIASTTQCYDPRRKDWAWPLLLQLGIPTHMYPPIVAPGTLLGNIAPRVAAEIGLVNLPVVVPACHDTASAVAAVPAKGGDFVYISSGTWSLMGIELPKPLINVQSMDMGFTNEGGVSGTFRFLKNIAGLWLVQECRRTWAQQGEEHTYAELTRLAAQAAPLQSVVDPDASEFLEPGDMPARIQAFCQRTGQPVPQGKGEIVRCALESLALKYRWVLERLEKISGRSLGPVHIVGGGSQNPLLNQLTADATGRPVLAGPVEATAAGNIIVQAMALGAIASLEEGRQVVRRSFEVTGFNPRHQWDWDQAYTRLQSLVEKAR